MIDEEKEVAMVTDGKELQGSHREEDLWKTQVKPEVLRTQ